MHDSDWCGCGTILIVTFYLLNVATNKVLEIPFLKTESGENSYSQVV